MAGTEYGVSLMRKSFVAVVIAKFRKFQITRTAVIVASVLLVIGAATLVTRGVRQRTVEQKQTVGAVPTGTNKVEAIKTSSVALGKAQQLIRALRDSAMKVTDVQALCLENAAALEQLRLLGAEAIPAYLEAIADKACPASLRVLLIEMVAHLGNRHDARVGQVLMAIITDTTDDKGVRMQALQWIPVTGDRSAGAKLLEILPQQTDADLEFGITRAMRGFKVPDSVGVLKSELADQKGYLTRIAATHAVAAQGGQDALILLQDSVATRLATGSQESHPEENTVSLHGIIALGEIPDASSLPILEAVAKNPANSVSVRNTAIQTIASIGGPDATGFIRQALLNESNESVLVYIARAMSLAGERTDASACLAKAATVSDSYTKTELQKAAQELQKKATR